MAGSNAIKPKAASPARPVSRKPSTPAKPTSAKPVSGKPVSAVRPTQGHSGSTGVKNGSSTPDSVTFSREALSLNRNESSSGPNLMAAYGETQSTPPAAAASNPSPTAPTQRTGREPVENFQYNGQAPGDYRGALNSPKPHAGTDANTKVNQEYDALRQAYGDYLGTDVASFPGLAQNGSVLAGEQIRNLENVLAGLQGDPKAMTDAMRGLGGNMDSIIQGALMGKGLAENAASRQNPLEAALAPPVVAGKVAGETVTDGVRTAQAMRDGLVAGNTEIHHSAAPAAHAFLKGEADGGKGMEELKKAGYYPGSAHDPHGLYTKAYSQLQDVRRLGLEAANEKDPAKKAELEKQRDEVMKSANRHLFTQEQLTLEQPHIYGNQDMKNAVRSIGGTMTLKDPNGTYNLLPKGGDWTDYETRMGYKKVDQPSKDSVTINGPNGQPIHYQSDPNAVGTVSHYSDTTSVGPRAHRIATTPVGSNALPAPSTGTGTSVNNIGTGLKNGDGFEVAGNVAALPARVGSDAVDLGSNAVKNSANPYYQAGFDNLTQGAKNGGVGGTFQQVYGGAQMLEGGLRETVGDAGKAVSKGLKHTGDHVEDVVESYKGGVVAPWDPRAKWWLFSNPFAK